MRFDSFDKFGIRVKPKGGIDFYYATDSSPEKAVTNPFWIPLRSIQNGRKFRNIRFAGIHSGLVTVGNGLCTTLKQLDPNFITLT